MTAAEAQAAPARQDIQFLRGVAVLAVLFYHSGLVPLSGGYLGVDVFFVISGYLITRAILNDLEQQRFSFTRFYVRRARRLLPAAYCTFAVTTLVAGQVLTDARWHDFVAQLLGAISFTANFVLPLQSGYFEAASSTKPLLHTWSLSVEEQYYLFAPILLWLVRPRWRLPLLATACLASLALCLLLVGARWSHWRFPALESQQLAFFMLPTRAWEMLVGSLLAWSSLRAAGPAPGAALKRSALALLCLLCAFPFDGIHPRGDALAVVALTALMIAGRDGWLGNSPAVRAVARVGDFSYSLYLVHWPLFALASNAYLGQVPNAVRAVLLVLSLLLAWLQYRFVEERFRHPPPGPAGGGLRWLLGSSLAVACLPLAVAATRMEVPAERFGYLRESNRGLSVACAAGVAVREPQACSTAPEPRIALWGDSYVMHLVPGLQRMPEAGASMLQITKAACAPVPGIASLDESHDETWARGCLEFSQRALELVLSRPALKTVILSSPFSGYMDHGTLKLFVDGHGRDGDRRTAIDRLVATVQQLQRAGRAVVIIAPPPRPGFDIGACHEQRGSGLLLLGRAGCDFTAAEYHRRQAGILEGLEEVRQRTGAPLLRFDALLCASGRCVSSLADGRSVYKDDGHLSIPGSAWAVPQLGLQALLPAAAP